MSQEPFGSYQVARTADLDTAQAAMEKLFLPLRLRLREPAAPLDMALNARPVGDMTASYVRFGRDVELVTAEADNYHVNIPITGATDSRSDNINIARTAGILSHRTNKIKCYDRLSAGGTGQPRTVR